MNIRAPVREGKTFCAFNVAMAFALEGQKTVLLDGDLRLPAVHRIFPDPEVASRRLGLADYLSGNANIDKILVAGPQQNLTVICAGNKTTNPGELLGADAFVTLIRTLEERFDRVIIDSAPVNAVSDTLRITPLVSYVCLVIRAGKTPKKAIARARKLIEMWNARSELGSLRASFSIASTSDETQLIIFTITRTGTPRPKAIGAQRKRRWRQRIVPPQARFRLDLRVA